MVEKPATEGMATDTLRDLPTLSTRTAITNTFAAFPTASDGSVIGDARASRQPEPGTTAAIAQTDEIVREAPNLEDEQPDVRYSNIVELTVQDTKVSLLSPKPEGNAPSAADPFFTTAIAQGTNMYDIQEKAALTDSVAETTIATSFKSPRPLPTPDNSPSDSPRLLPSSQAVNVKENRKDPRDDEEGYHAMKIYIGGLPERTEQLDLEDCFGQFGKIAHIELKLGFAFIVFYLLYKTSCRQMLTSIIELKIQEFVTVEATNRAIETYNEGTFLGQTIRVEATKSRTTQAKSIVENTCFTCGEHGHYARHCPEDPRNKDRLARRSVSPERGLNFIDTGLQGKSREMRKYRPLRSRSPMNPRRSEESRDYSKGSYYRRSDDRGRSERDHRLSHDSVHRLPPSAPSAGGSEGEYGYGHGREPHTRDSLRHGQRNHLDQERRDRADALRDLERRKRRESSYRDAPIPPASRSSIGRYSPPPIQGLGSDSTRRNYGSEATYPDFNPNSRDTFDSSRTEGRYDLSQPYDGRIKPETRTRHFVAAPARSEYMSDSSRGISGHSYMNDYKDDPPRNPYTSYTDLNRLEAPHDRRLYSRSGSPSMNLDPYISSAIPPLTMPSLKSSHQANHLPQSSMYYFPSKAEIPYREKESIPREYTYPYRGVEADMGRHELAR